MAKRAACGTLLVVTVSFWMLAAGSLPAESSPGEGVAEAPAVQMRPLPAGAEGPTVVSGHLIQQMVAPKHV